ncbi:uncharacterized protein LOC144623217 [Crassostrea virginica]
MEVNGISSQVSIKHCGFCPGTTEYYCHDCKGDLCRPCKETHVDILDIQYHKVTFYRGKFNNSLRQAMCTKHPDQVIKMHCEHCDLPVCSNCLHCKKHRKHKIQKTKRAYEKKLLKFNDILIKISSQSIYNAQVLLNAIITSDFTSFREKIEHFKTPMLTISESVKDSMDNVQSEICNNKKALLVREFLGQRKKMKRNIARIQRYEDRFEKIAYRPVQFLLFIKKVRLPQMQDTPHLSHSFLFTLIQEINIDELVKLLSDIDITESGKQRRAENKLQLTLMLSPVFQKSLSVPGVILCYHISCLKPDLVWVSDDRNIVLANKATGDTLYHLGNVKVPGTGKHTVNSDRELIYICSHNDHYNISKLSENRKTTTLLIENMDPLWKPLCVHCSPSSGDLLVGMHRCYTDTHQGKVIRYDKTGKHTQTIPDNNTLDDLYGKPLFITENNNGDVVVSDSGHAVVVTSRKGVHRFSYTGHPPSGPQLCPEGVCTDALSHILVADAKSTIHMLSQDGEFLKYLLRNQSPESDNFTAFGLSYDPYTHCLWVGSWNDKTLSVYRHINRHPAILGPS